jgi:phosphoglycolate phosphatase-like HAD superfamily hydrolase
VKLVLDFDAVLADTRPLWRGWLDDAARRFRSIAELDPDALPEDRAEAAALLDRWAEAGVGDWRGALERFAEDRAPLFFRPAPATNAALRRLRAEGAALGAFSDAPESLVRVALAHVGLARELTVVTTGADAERRALEELGADARVVRSRDELLGLRA